MKEVDHIAFNVRDIDSVALKFQEIFGCKPSEKEFVESQNVDVMFLEFPNVKLELIQSRNNPALEKHLGTADMCFHHLALVSADINYDANLLKEKKISLIYPSPKLGAKNKLINFLNPRKTLGLLIELCQYNTGNRE